jgi:hypothetical protein
MKMGTRYTIKFSETRKSRAFANLYGQFDGYLSGAGCGIKKALTGLNGEIRQLVNGFSEAFNQVNGMGNAAAMVTAHLMSEYRRNGIMGCGGVYLQSKSEGCGEEFRYHLFGEDKELRLVVRAVQWEGTDTYAETWPIVFDGYLREFDGKALEKGGE